MQVQSLGREDPLEGDSAMHSSILAWRIPWTEDPGATVHGFAESDTTEGLSMHPCVGGKIRINCKVDQKNLLPYTSL